MMPTTMPRSHRFGGKLHIWETVERETIKGAKGRRAERVTLRCECGAHKTESYLR